MKHFIDLVAETLADISEEFPWDIEEKTKDNELQPLILDIREADEFTAMHIQGSLHVPRGILESACE